MTTQLRQYLAILLALMLSFTGQAMAVARGASSASGQMVICSGNGPLIVSVDENGQPTGPPYICPDYALSLIAATGDAPNFPTSPIGRKSTLKFDVAQFAPPLTVIRASARAPPVLQAFPTL